MAYNEQLEYTLVKKVKRKERKKRNVFNYNLYFFQTKITTFLSMFRTVILRLGKVLLVPPELRER